MSFGMYSPASSAFTGSPAGFHLQASMFPESSGDQCAPSPCQPSGVEDLSSFIEQLSLPAASRLTPVEQLQNTPILMGDTQHHAVDTSNGNASNLPFCTEAFYSQAAASCPEDIMSSLSVLNMPFSSPLEPDVLLGAQATPPAPFAAWGMSPMAVPVDQQTLAHQGVVLYPGNGTRIGGIDVAIDSGASQGQTQALLHSSPSISADCVDFLRLTDNGSAGSNNHQTLAQPPATIQYPPLFSLGNNASAASSGAPTLHTQIWTGELNSRSTATVTAAGSHHVQHGTAHKPLDFDAPNNISSSSAHSSQQNTSTAAAFIPEPHPATLGNSGHGYVSSSSDRKSPRARSGSSSWKNQPRNSISKRQKLVFYRWLLENTRFPFPSDEERLGCLAVEPMSEKQFKYWFANIRCRQFVKHRSPNGEFFFTPNAKFYESCLRLKIEISGCIPMDVRCVMRKPRRPSN